MALEIKVLVVLPVSDEIEYLNGCIDSILNSTLGGVEVAIASGFLLPEMKEKVDWYTAQYDRVRLISKGSAAEAVESIVSGAKSEFIFFMNIYDRLTINALEKYYEAATSEGAEIVFGRMNFRRKDYVYPSDLLPFSDKGHIADEYLAGLANGRYKDEDKWAKMYATSLVKNYGGLFSKFEDTEFLALVFSYAAKFVYLDMVALERDLVVYEAAAKEEMEWTLPEDITKKRLEGIEYCYAEGNSARVEVLSRVLIRQLNKYIIDSKGDTAFEELRDKIQKGEETRKQEIVAQERREMEEAKKKKKNVAWWMKWIIFALIAARLIAKFYSLLNGMAG